VLYLLGSHPIRSYLSQDQPDAGNRVTTIELRQIPIVNLCLRILRLGIVMAPVIRCCQPLLIAYGLFLGLGANPGVHASEGVAHLLWSALNEPGSGGAITALAVSPYDSRRVLVGGDMLGIGVSENRGIAWLPGSALPSYEIGEFTFHPKDPAMVWAGTMSGPCVSRDGGRTWQWQRRGFPAIGWGNYSAPIQKIVFDPQHTGRLLAFGGSRRRWNSPNEKSVWAVWESLNDGNTCQELSRIDGVTDVMAAGFGPGANPALYVAMHGKGVWRSDDGGHTWVRRSEGLTDGSVTALAIDPDRPGRVWASVGSRTGGGIFLTTDGGEHWRKPNTLYACEFDWQGGTIFISNDAGETWRASLNNTTFHRAYAAGAQMSVVTVDPRDPLTAFVGNTETVARTTDGGRTWSDSTSQAVGQDTWRGCGYSGLCAMRFRFDPAMRGHSALVAMDHGNLWQSRDDFASWTWGGGGKFPVWGKVQDVAFAGDTGKIMYLALESCDLGVVARTSDGGKQWHACASRGLSTERVTTILSRPSTPEAVWIVDHRGRVFRSSDAGESWHELLDAVVSTLSFADDGRATLFAGGKQGLFRADDGEHFSKVADAPTGITALAISGTDQLTLVLASDNAIWLRSADSWKRVCERERIGNVVIDPGDPRRIAFTTSDDPYHDQTRATGVWLSSDGGVTWSQQTNGLPMLRGGALALDPHDATRLVLGTNGRGYFVTHWPR
jgi:photosystem II stability/assembly factor-like uncharacterized protein